ncbi:MAG: NYN domain-containing protein [Betaproteobacteria bacterium]
MPHQDRLNIAVFIDFDNIEIGVKSTLNEHFDVGTILEAIKERGEVVTKIAYADWTRAGEYSRNLTQHAIRLVQRNLTPGGDKNGADINLALDALEMAFTHPHINAYVIVGGDSDFLSLVEKLKQYDKKVFVVGGRGFTSIILQRNCHEFIAYENLTRSRGAVVKGGRAPAPTAAAPIAQAFPIVRRALKILSDREVSPQTGLLKSTLLQLDSTFSERNYGASSFLDFVEKLAKSGLVHLKHAGRSVMAELNEEFDESTPPEAAQPEMAASQPEAEPSVQAPHQDALPPLGDNAAGVARVAAILTAATNARWPMYLRNAKQILRSADGGFDERRYGFGGLMDLLRACQREGLVRMERDRRGGLRVFPGSNLQRGPAAPVALAPVDVETGSIETQPGELVQEPVEGADVEPVPSGPMPVDTTAELLGTRPRKPRAAARTRPAAGGASPSRGTRRAAAPRKTATPRRSTRSKKAPGDVPDDIGNV